MPQVDDLLKELDQAIGSFAPAGQAPRRPAPPPRDPILDELDQAIASFTPPPPPVAQAPVAPPPARPMRTTLSPVLVEAPWAAVPTQTPPITLEQVAAARATPPPATTEGMLPPSLPTKPPATGLAESALTQFSSSIARPVTEAASVFADMGVPGMSATAPVREAVAFYGQRQATEHVLDNPGATLGNPMWWAETAGQAAGSIAALMSVGRMQGGKFVVTAAEAAMEGLNVYQQARDQGVSPTEAGKAAVITVAENMPWIFVTNTPLLEPVTKSRLLNAVFGAGSEATQEAGQEVISNAAAKATFDPARPYVGKEVADAALVGSLVGAPVAGLQAPRVEAPTTLEEEIAAALGSLRTEPSAAPGTPETGAPPQEGQTNRGPEADDVHTGEPTTPPGPPPGGPPVAPTVPPPAPPVAPPPPPSLNPKLPDALIVQLRQAGVSPDVIRTLGDADEATFVLEQAQQQNQKPKAPVRARREFGRAPEAEAGWTGYLGRERQVQQDVLDDEETARILRELDETVAPSSQQEQTGAQGSDDTAITPAGPAPDDRTAERGGAEEDGAVGPAGVDAGTGFRADDTETREQHNERLFQHVLADARRQDSGVSEDTVRQRFTDAVRTIEEFRAELDTYSQEDPSNPDVLLQAIHDAGGLYDDTLYQPMSKSGKITTKRRMTGELRQMMEGSRFGRIGTKKQADGSTGYWVVRRPGQGPVRKAGLRWDEMRHILSADPIFREITEDVNTFQAAVEDAIRAIRFGQERGTFSEKKITPEDLEVDGIFVGAPWWQQADDAIAPSEEGKPAPPVTARADEDEAPPRVLDEATDKKLNDALDALDDLLGPGDLEPGSLGMAAKKPGAPVTPKSDLLDTGEVQPRLPEAGVVRDTDVATPELDAPFSLERETVQRPKGKQKSLFDSLGMAAGPDPTAVKGAIQVMRVLGDAGIHDFAKAVQLLAQKKGRAWVENLGRALPMAWEAARRQNPKLGPASADIGAILEAVPDERAGTGPSAGDSREPGVHPEPAGGRPGTGTPVESGHAGVRPESGADVVAGEQGGPVQDRPPAATPADARVAAREAAATSEHVAPYARRTELRGTEHPKLIVEAKALSGVPYPALTESFQSPHAREAVEKGRVSVEQAEQALAAVQANLGSSDRPGHGFVIADGVGVGKSRELALVLIELMHRAKADGRDLRLLFTTLREPNIVDFRNELAYVASGRTREGLDLAKQDELSTERGAPGTVPFDIVDVREFRAPDDRGGKGDPLPAKARAVYIVDHIANLSRYVDRIAELKLHGIVADEAHALRRRDTAKAAAWQLLHAQVYLEAPRREQVFVYASATPAQETTDFEYLYGLRLWPIDGFADWVQVITGLADTTTAERVLKYIREGGDDVTGIVSDTAQGRRVGRTSFAVITEAESEQVPRELKALGRMSSRDLWRHGTEFRVHQADLPQAAEQRYNAFAQVATEVMHAYQQFGATNSSFARAQLILAAKRVQMEPMLREAIERGKRYVESGHQVVFSVLHRSGIPNMGTTGNLSAAIDMIKDTVVDDAGNEVLNPAAAAEKARLRAAAKEIGPLVEPGEAIKQAFGEDQYAELVGDMNDTQRAAVRQFQSGERAVIMITAAGSTGVNLQQRFLTGKGTAQGRRVFIPVQNEWSAIQELQRYGRVDRADSVMPPIIQPISFGSALEKRFFGSIAARMKSLGALSRGGGSETTQSLESFDFADPISLHAVREAWRKAPSDLRVLFSGDAFKQGGRPREELPRQVGVDKVQQALMFLPVRRANQFWNLFLTERDALIAAGASNQDAKTRSHRGRILKTIELGEQVTLHMVRNENGTRFGILQGVVMPHMPRLRSAVSEQGGSVRRTYGVFTRSDTKDLIAGLEVQWSHIPRVARAFGKVIEWTYDKPADVLHALQAGEHVALAAKNENGRHLVLRMGHDGFLLDYATLKMREQLTGAGVTYDAKSGGLWKIPNEEKLLTFLRTPAFRAKGTSAQFGWKGKDDPSYFGMRTPGSRPPFLKYPRPRGLPVTSKADGQMGPRQIREYLEDRLQMPIRAKGVHGGAWGLYFLRSRGARRQNMPWMIRTHIDNDLPVIAHEVGHHIHETLLGLDPKHAAWTRELITVGRTTTLPSYNLRQKLAEGQAEFTRLWFIDPTAAFLAAPNYAAAFEAQLAKPEFKELAETLRTVQAQIRGFVELDDAERIKARISFDDPTPTGDTRTWMQKLRQWVDDDLVRLQFAVADMAKGKRLTFTEDAYRLALKARSYADQARTFLEHGIRNSDGQFIVPYGLPAIMKKVKGREQDFATYLVARRAQELHARPGITEWAVDRAWADAAVRKLDSPEFEKAANMLYAWQDGLLIYAQQEGVLNADQVEAMRKLNQNYVPWQRVMDAWAARAGARMPDTLANRTSPFRTIHGSGKDIINPLESIVRNTFVLTNLVEHNNAMRALVEQARNEEASARWVWPVKTPRTPVFFKLSAIEKALREALRENGIDLPPGVDLDKTAQVWVPMAFANGNQRLVSYLDKGKREFAEINDKALFDTLVVAGPVPFETLLRWVFVKPANLLRGAVTKTPGFIVRNFLRDPWVAFVQSRYGFIPGIDHAAAFYHIMKRTDLFQTFMTSGGGQASLSSLSREQMDRELRRVTGMQAAKRRHRVRDVVMRPFDLLGALSEIVELLPRVGEFRLAVQALGERGRGVGRAGIAGRLRRVGQPVEPDKVGANTLMEATEAAKALTLNFQRGGSLVRLANQAVPFLNPKVQGYSRLAQTLSPSNIRQDPEVLARTALIPLLSFALWALNHDDDDYRKIEQWERDSYWHIPAPWTETGYIRWPKPFEYASLFGNFLEAALDYAYKEDPEATERAVRQVFSTRDVTGEGVATALVTSLIPVVAMPWVENQTNYDLFFGRPISEPFQGDRDKQYLDYNRWTSHSMRKLGELLDYSPAKLENFVYSYTSNMGTGLLRAADVAMGATGLAPTKPAQGLSGVPGLGALWSDPGTKTSRSMRRLYEVNDKLTGVTNDLSDLGALGRLAERAAQIVDRREILERGTLLREGIEELRDRRRAMDVVLNSTRSPREKDAQLRRLYYEMDTIARRALGEPVAPVPHGKLPVTARR